MSQESEQFRLMGRRLRAFLEGFLGTDVFDAVKSRPQQDATPVQERDVVEKVSVNADGTTTLIQRRLNHSVDRVWESLTKPDKLSSWLAKTNVELHEGVDFEFSFDNTGAKVNGTVTKFEPPHVLEYTWVDQSEPESLPAAVHLATGNGSCVQDLRMTRMKYILTALPQGGTLLSLEHSLVSPARAGLESPARDVDVPTVLASWQNHFDGLANSLSGRLESPDGQGFSWNRWKHLRSKYEEILS